MGPRLRGARRTGLVLSGLAMLLIAGLEVGSSSGVGGPPRSLAKQTAKQSGSLDQALSQLPKLISGQQLDAAVASASQCLRTARALRRPDLEMAALRYRGSAEMRQQRTRPALSDFMAARAIAEKLQNYQYLYILNNNIAWIYHGMNDFDLAGDTVDKALDALRQLGIRKDAVTLLRATIYGYQHNFPAAERLFSDAISNSLDRGDRETASAGWRYLGEAYLAEGRVDDAEYAATEAYRLTRNPAHGDRELVLCDLGSVKAQQGDLTSAARLMERGLVLLRGTEATGPAWWYYKERGKLRVLENDPQGALADFKTSLDMARRLDVIQTDDDRVAFESGIAELYSLVIDTENQLAQRTKDPAMLREAFETAEENRATSLLELVPQPNDWRFRLAPEHGAVLSELELSERSRLVADSPQLEKHIADLHTRLNELEVQAGAHREEDRASSLEAARAALPADAVLLSFRLGKRNSWLWAIAKDRFDLYPLPSKSELARPIAEFRKSLMTEERPSALGASLYASLFGTLAAPFREKHSWILELDQDLFDVPFGALQSSGKFLIEDHEITLTPTARITGANPARREFRGPIAGFGDPIYNTADTRWRGERTFPFLRPRASESQLGLARLPGSGAEVESSVRIWGDGNVREGADVNRRTVMEALSGDPAVVHLATHVVRFPYQRSGTIVLSLGVDGKQEFLDARDIVLKPVKAGLIVMSGCGSGDAAVLKASGLMGLTRAWLAAGAGSVLATRWPALDDTDPFFAAFYTQLKRNPADGAGEALRMAQVEMIHSGTFRGAPKYWASYFLTGGL